MAKARYRENPQLDWTELDGKKLTIKVKLGYIVGVEANRTPHILLIGVNPRESKEEAPDGDASVQPV